MTDSESPEDKDGEIRFKVSSHVWKYLSWLTRHTVLGKTENEVAKQLLIDRLATMRQEYYRDNQKP